MVKAGVGVVMGAMEATPAGLLLMWLVMAIISEQNDSPNKYNWQPLSSAFPSLRRR